MSSGIATCPSGMTLQETGLEPTQEQADQVYAIIMAALEADPEMCGRFVAALRASERAA